jgi:hypothetical protein
LWRRFCDRQVEAAVRPWLHSFASQAGAQPVSQPPAPGTESLPVIDIKVSEPRQFRHSHSIGRRTAALALQTAAESFQERGACNLIWELLNEARALKERRAGPFVCVTGRPANGPATGGQPPVAGGAAGNPATTGPPPPGVIPHDAARSNLQSAAPSMRPSSYMQSAAPGAASGTRMATGHHRNMYMSTKGSHHKTLKTGQQLPKQPQ